VRSGSVVAIRVGSGLAVIQGLRFAFLMGHSITIVVPDGEAETGWVDVLVAPQKEGAEARLSQEVKYTVEDGFTVGGNEVAVPTLATV
jgi:hypothetical protein